MTPDERRAYLEAQLRRSPAGSARHVWAAAMLAQLDANKNARATRQSPSRQTHTAKPS
jgi:hypothetical protein